MGYICLCSPCREEGPWCFVLFPDTDIGGSLTGLWSLCSGTLWLPRGPVIKEGWTCLRGKPLPISSQLSAPPCALSCLTPDREGLLSIAACHSYHGSDAVGCCGADGVMVRISGCIDSAVTKEVQGRTGCKRGAAEAGTSWPAFLGPAPFPQAPPSRLEGSFWNLGD